MQQNLIQKFPRSRHVKQPYANILQNYLSVNKLQKIVIIKAHHHERHIDIL